MDFKKNIEDHQLVFLDLETTGLDAVMGDAICEIGALKVQGRGIVDKFHSLVNPKRAIPQEAYRVHKISDDEVRHAPFFEKIADKLIKFVEGSVVCAYNVGFDMGFVNHQLKGMDYEPLKVPAVDILAMARDALELSRYNLQPVAQSLDIDCSNGLHRALDDASVAYQVFFKLNDIFRQKGIHALEQFISLYGFNNEFFSSQENQKISVIEEAIDRKGELAIQYFSFKKCLEEERIVPLKISREERFWYLLYQGQNDTTTRLRSNRILKVEVL